MQARPAGHLIETPDMSDASTSKQKPKHHKPIPYVFHTYVKAESANQSCPSVDASGSSSTVTIPPAPAAPLISDLQGMQLCDKKRPRDDDDAGTSTITLKKIKLPPLQVTDFPDIGMDLELLPDDLLDSDPDMIAVSAALTDSMGEEATPLRPPGPG
ncbi:hypothetical protein LINGRAHAP2_LOCUS4178 [Linum grandiflorum]